MITVQHITDYLSTHVTDPVQKYILVKEIYNRGPSSPEYVNAYNDLKQSKWYRELADDQLDNGSWGSYHGGAKKTQKGFKFGGTEPALRRARELSLTKDDPIIAKALRIMVKYATREIPYPDGIEKGKDKGKGRYYTIPFEIAASINVFDPDNPVVQPLQNVIVENYKAAFTCGGFDLGIYHQAVREYRAPGMFEPGNPFDIYLVQNGDCLGDTLQRQYLDFIWSGKARNVYVTSIAPTALQHLENKAFIPWLVKLEILSPLTLFPEFIKDSVLPHLLNECDRLIYDDVVLPNSPSGHGTTCSHTVNGRYAENWRDISKRKTDMILRIARILVKTGEQ